MVKEKSLSTDPNFSATQNQESSQFFITYEGLAKELGVSEAFIHNLYDRYHVIQTTPYEYQGKTVRRLTEHDVEIAREVVRRRNGGEKMKNIINSMRLENAPQIAETYHFMKAYLEWFKQPNWETFEKTVNAWLSSPDLTTDERAVLQARIYGKSIKECAKMLGVKSQDEIEQLIKAAEIKLGGILLESLQFPQS